MNNYLTVPAAPPDSPTMCRARLASGKHIHQTLDSFTITLKGANRRKLTTALTGPTGTMRRYILSGSVHKTINTVEIDISPLMEICLHVLVVACKV